MKNITLKNFNNINEFNFLGREELAEKIEKLQKELEAERVSKGLLESKLASNNEKSNENEEIQRLTKELEKLEIKYTETWQQEEEKRQQAIEHWKVNSGVFYKKIFDPGRTRTCNL